jgi:hypothetical protein
LYTLNVEDVDEGLITYGTSDALLAAMEKPLPSESTAGRLRLFKDKESFKASPS